MKFAYADPPYHKQGKKHYGEHHDDAAVWDAKSEHLKLLARLVEEYPDGWALSCNPADLRWLLPVAPEGTRVCSWVKTFHPIRLTSVQFAWEAVLLYGGRKDQQRNPMVRDWYLGKPTRLQKLPGAKSFEFNSWILDLLNYQDSDQLDDLFPGTGGMAVAANQINLWRSK